MADGEVDDWDDLPEPLVDFIQHQDGLKFNGSQVQWRPNFVSRCVGDRLQPFNK
jgi:hypothetical protein